MKMGEYMGESTFEEVRGRIGRVRFQCGFFFM